METTNCTHTYYASVVVTMGQSPSTRFVAVARDHSQARIVEYDTRDGGKVSSENPVATGKQYELKKAEYDTVVTWLRFRDCLDKSRLVDAEPPEHDSKTPSSWADFGSTRMAFGCQDRTRMWRATIQRDAFTEHLWTLIHYDKLLTATNPAVKP